LGPGFFFFNFINKMRIYNVYENPFDMLRCEINGFIYVVDAHFNDKIGEKKNPGPKCLWVKSYLSFRLRY